MSTEFMCDVLTIAGLLLVVCAAVIVPLSIFGSVERLGDEIHDYFEGEEDE